MTSAAFTIKPLAQNPNLSERVQRTLRISDWQTFILAMTVLIGGGFLAVSPSVGDDVKLAAVGFMGMVLQFFFGNKTTMSSAAATIAAQQTVAPTDQKPGA